MATTATTDAHALAVDRARREVIEAARQFEAVCAGLVFDELIAELAGTHEAAVLFDALYRLRAIEEPGDRA